MRTTVPVLALLFAVLAVVIGLAMLGGSPRTPVDVVAAAPSSDTPSRSELAALDDPRTATREGAPPVVHEIDPSAISPRITGTVVDAVGGAQLIAVGALPVPAEGRARRVKETRCADDGSFELFLPSEGEYVLVAVARDRRPTSTVVLVDFDAPERPLDNVFRAKLEPGKWTEVRPELERE